MFRTVPLPQTTCLQSLISERKRKDAQAAYEEQLQSAGMGKAPRKVTRPDPVNRLDLLPDGTPSGVTSQTSQADMLPAVTNYYRQQLNNIYYLRDGTGKSEVQ